MWSVLKAAFLHRERVPALGSVPVNALAVLTFAALGFGHPLFWWLGGGLEAAWLFLCVTSPRYRRVATLSEKRAEEESAAEKLEAVFQRLNAEHRRRHETLRERGRRLTALWENDGGDASGTGVDQLEWLHLKFLLAKQHLEAAEAEAPGASISARLADLRAKLEAPGMAPAARSAHEATLRIVEERLATSQERVRRIEEMEASLHRIEQQLDLTLEKALMRADDGGAAGHAGGIDLASHTLTASSELFGGSLGTVSDLDEFYSTPSAARAAE